MSNGLTPEDQSEFLFKNLLQLPTNKPGFAFFNEDRLNFNTYTKSEDLFLQPVPFTPIWERQDDVGRDKYPNHTFEEYYVDETGLLEKFVKLDLREVPTTNGKSYTAFVNNDPNTKETILSDMYQFNYGDRVSFMYEIYKSDGSRIDLTNTNFNPIVDVKTGYITFFKKTETLVANGVSSSSPPKMSFVRYIGQKGIDFMNLQDVVVKESFTVEKDANFLQSLTVSGDVLIENNLRVRKNFFVDGSRVFLHTETLDICDNIIQLNKGMQNVPRGEHMLSGLEIVRGTVDDVSLSLYNVHYLYDKEREDAGKQAEFMIIGVSNEEQPLATRKYDISHATIPYWNNQTYQFDFTPFLVVDTSNNNKLLPLFGIGLDAPTKTLDLSGDGLVRGDLDVCGNAYFNSELDVSKRAVFYQSVDVCGQSHLWNKVDVDGSLNVAREVILQDTIDVCGQSHFWNKVDVDGSLTIQKHLIVDGKFINDEFQTNTQLRDYLTKQPPVFTKQEDTTTNTNGVIDLHWFKGTEYDISYQLSFNSLELPYIQTIHIDVSSNLHPEPVVWDIIPKDRINYPFYFNDVSGSIIFNDTQQYTISVYGVNNTKDVSYQKLVYQNVEFDLTGMNIPTELPTIIQDYGTLQVNNISTITVNGIDIIQKFNIQNLSFTVHEISPSFRSRIRDASNYADLVLGDALVYQEQITTDVCGGTGVMRFYANPTDTFKNIVVSLNDLYTGGSGFTYIETPNNWSNLLRLQAYNVFDTTDVGVSLSLTKYGLSVVWVDPSSVVLDEFGRLTNQIVEHGRNTYDVSMITIGTDSGTDISIVRVEVWEQLRDETAALDENSLLFIEGRYCGASYISPNLGGGVYRDWGSVDYSGYTTTGLPDVIVSRGVNDGTAPFFKWCIRRFKVKADSEGRFRTILLDNQPRDQWARIEDLRVYVLQYLYTQSDEPDENDATSDLNYADRTTWMDARKMLSMRYQESPYTITNIDGYGCGYGTQQIALKLNSRLGNWSVVYVLVGIANDATELTSIERIELV